MTLLEDKELAKEILLKCIEQSLVKRSTETETPIEAVCAAYREILKTVKED